nr:hypothetical protein [Tanacetum cinerariifolium]
MTILAEFMIIVGVDNHPPMLEKYLYDSWKSHMELYMENRENRENGRMILDSVLNGPLVWPTVVLEDGTTRKKTYAELSVTEKLQADCDLKATNIVLQGLPPDVIVVPVFSQGDDPIACLNKAMVFLIVVSSLRLPSTNNQLRTSLIQETMPLFKTAWLHCNKFKGGKDKIMMTDDLDAYDYDCDDVSNVKAVLMANLSNYGSDVIAEEKTNQEKNNKSLTAKLERYKDRVKTLEQRLNIDLNTCEKMIDSQIDDMINEKLALK